MMNLRYALLAVVLVLVIGPVLASGYYPPASCDRIHLSTVPVSVNSESAKNFFVGIENTSNVPFFLDDFSVTETSSFLNIDSDYANYWIPAHATAQHVSTATAAAVYLDQTITGRARVSGRFANGLSCSYLHIGEKTVPITVKAPVSDFGTCNQIIVDVFPVNVAEDSLSFETFLIRNNTGKRFFINSVEISDEGDFVLVQKDYFDPIIPSYQTGELRVKISAEEVSGNRSGNVRIRIRGEFEGGAVCNQVPDRVFSVTVENSAPDVTCNQLGITGESFRLSQNGSQSRVFTVTNNSELDFSVYDVKIEETDPEFAVQLISKSSTIPAHGTGTIQLRATTGTLDASGIGGFRLQLRGEFENREICSFSDVSKEIAVELVKDTPTPNPEVCRSVSIEAFPLLLESGSSKTDFFKVLNGSNRTFYIDSVNMFDDSTDFSLSETTFDLFAPSGGGIARVWFSAQANRVSSEGDRTGFIQVSGHFADGATCSFTAIGTESFPVVITPKDSDETCPDFKLEVPDRVVASDDVAWVDVRVFNPTDQDAFVYLSGTNLSVSPSVISAPPNGWFSTTVKATLLSGSETNLEFRPSVFDCTALKKFTRIVSRETGDGDIRIASLPSSVVFVKKTTVKVLVENNSNFSRTVDVKMGNILNGWTTESHSVSVPRNESVPVYIDIFSNNVFGEADAVVGLFYSGDLVDERDILIKAVPKLSASDVLTVTISVVPVSPTETQVHVQVTNFSDSQVSGDVWIELPAGWSVSNNRSVFTLNPNESNTRIFSAKPSASATDGNGSVVVALDDGRSDRFAFTMKRFGSQLTPSNGFFAGLFSLGRGVFSSGLLILLIVLAVVLVFLFLDNQYREAHPPRIRHPPFSVIDKNGQYRSNGRHSWRA